MLTLFKLVGLIGFIIIAVVGFMFHVLYYTITDYKYVPVYLQRMFLSFDQLANTALDGNEDETISSRLGRRIQSGEATWIERKICCFLSRVDPDTERHCLESIEHGTNNLPRR